MSKRNVFITGGSGFIGTRLISFLLDRNVKCVNFDKVISKTYPDLSIIGDVRSFDSLRSNINSIDTIIHLAAEHKDNVYPLSLYTDVNVNSAINICNVAREKDIRTIIFTSTVAVYGFAAPDTDENGIINPFNEYGRSKYQAELIFKKWQSESPVDRTLLIIRPTVVFGEGNRGNVFNLLNQIAKGYFIMIGHGDNRKSLAYVENLVAYIYHCFTLSPGIHTYNYIDKPDYTMNMLVQRVYSALGKTNYLNIKIPFSIALIAGKFLDFVSFLFQSEFAISSIRIRKFCSDTVFETSVNNTDFIAPVTLDEALQKTIKFEFIDRKDNVVLHFTE